MNSQGELSDRKRCRDASPNAPPSPEQSRSNKKKKKSKKGSLNAEPNGQPQVCPNPNPVAPVGATPIPISAEKEQRAEPIGATAENPVSESTPQKKKSKKRKKEMEKDVLQVESEQMNAKEEGAGPSEASAVQHQVCHKQEIEALLENKCVELKETSAEQPQVCSKEVLAPMVVVDHAKAKGMGKNIGAAEQSELGPVPDSAPSKDTPSKKKSKKKNVVNDQGVEPNGSIAEELQLWHPVEPATSIGVELKIVKEIGVGRDDVNAERALVCSKHEPAIPIVLGKKEGAESIESGPKHESVIPEDTGKKKVAGPNEASVEHLLPVPESAPSKNTPRKKKWEKKKKNINVQGVEPKGSNAEELQLCHPGDPTISIGVVPRIVKEIGAGPDDVNAERASVCSERELAIPVDTGKKEGAGPNEASSEQPELLFPVSHPTLPKDTPQLKLQEAEPKESNNPEHPQVCSKPKSAPQIDSQHVVLPSKGSGKKERNCVLKCEVVEPNKQNDKPPEIPVQGSICLIAASQTDQTIPIDQKLSINPVTPIDPEQKMGKKKKRKLRSEVAGPNKQNDKPPEIPVQRSICPIAASRTDQTMLTDPNLSIDPATPIDPEQKMGKKRRRKKSKSTLKSKVGEPNKQNDKPPEIPVQRSICSIAASQTDQTIPVDPNLSIDPATPIHPEQKIGKKKRRKKSKSNLKSKVVEPIKQNVKPPEIPVQRSICPIVASQMNQPILIDQNLSIDPEQKMVKKKRRKKCKSALKSKGLELDHHNAESTAKILDQRTTGLEVTRAPIQFYLIGGSSVSKCNAEPPAKTQIRRTKGLKVTTTVKFKRHGGSSVRCLSCHQPDHKFKNCPRLKRIPNNEEICFFCAEIGHSLGKCSVFKAGGGRFARCLFCYGYGHFTNKCPQNGCGIDPKEDGLLGAYPGNGPIDKSAVDTKEGCS